MLGQSLYDMQDSDDDCINEFTAEKHDKRISELEKKVIELEKKLKECVNMIVNRLDNNLFDINT